MYYEGNCTVFLICCLEDLVSLKFCEKMEQKGDVDSTIVENTKKQDNIDKMEMSLYLDFPMSSTLRTLLNTCIFFIYFLPLYWSHNFTTYL